jgi:hypothetical protein
VQDVNQIILAGVVELYKKEAVFFLNGKEALFIM